MITSEAPSAVSRSAFSAVDVVAITRVLELSPPQQGSTAGVGEKAVFTWTLTTGVPMVGLILMIAFANESGVSLKQLSLSGLVVGLGRYARAPWFSWPATAFVEFFRNTPVLVQILWFYFALPMLLPFEISPLAAAALGISLNSAAFSG